MRTFLIGLALLILGVTGYAYATNPAGCWKIVTDFKALCISVSPVQIELRSPGPPESSTPVPAPAPTQASIHVAMATPSPLATPASLPTPLPPSPLKKWTPPDVIPSQPNWTWTTSDGKTYQNVTITDIKPDFVVITHSLGVAHIDISMLPTDLQKQLNYDPIAAAFAKAENQRETDHPYYPLAYLPEAQSVARQLHRPLAWMCSDLNDLSVASPQTGSAEDLTQMALAHLKSQAVVIFLNGNDDLPALSPIIRDQQLFQLDDGPMPGGHHFYAPKIVFSDADVTKAFGRVSYTQMLASREAAIDTALQSIANDPAAQALLNGQPASAPTTAAAP